MIQAPTYIAIATYNNTKRLYSYKERLHKQLRVRLIRTCAKSPIATDNANNKRFQLYCHNGWTVTPKSFHPAQNCSTRTDFGKRFAKSGPPGPILAAKIGPSLPKTWSPLGDQIWQTYAGLPKSVPQAKLRVYTQSMHAH